MKLYMVPGSNNCRKAQATHRHLGLTVEETHLDFMAGDLQADAFKAVNPNAKVPVLEDGDVTLWESNAICQYLADKAGDTSFYPTDPAARADIHRWQFWELAHYNQAIGVIAYETILKPLFMKTEPDAAAVEGARGMVARFAPVLDARLAGRAFIMGDDLTVADFSVGAYGGFMGQFDLDLDGYPNLKAWYRRLDTIPAWAATAPPDFSEMAAE